MTTVDAQVRLSSGRTLWLAALLGIAISAGLHLYFVAKWESYTASISPLRLRQIGNSTPPAHMTETKLSAFHGALLLALVGGVVPLIFRRRIPVAVAAFLAGVLSVQLVSSVHARGLGNLWPISFAAITILIAVPIVVGAAITAAILRAATSKRT